MRKSFKFIGFIAIMLASFSSCIDHDLVYETIDFEDVALDGDTTLKYTSFTTKGMTFHNVVNDWGFWSGMAASTKNNMLIGDYTNDLSVYAPNAASGRKFAVAFNDGASCSFPSNTSYLIKELKVNNNSYAYLSMKNGDLFAKKFAAGDWFKLTIYGYTNSGMIKDSVDFYLADFRNGKSYICDSWTTVNIRKLGLVNKLSFSFSSTDNGTWGMNTPAYVCIDDLTYVLGEEDELEEKNEND